MTSTATHPIVDTSALLTAHVAAWQDKTIPEAALYAAYHKTNDINSVDPQSLFVSDFLGALLDIGWHCSVNRNFHGPEHPVAAAYEDGNHLWNALSEADEEAFEDGWEGRDENDEWVSDKNTWSPEIFVRACRDRGVTFVRITATD